jgi:probable rRNA maturation factor
MPLVTEFWSMVASTFPIAFHSLIDSFSLRDRTQLKRFLQQQVEKEGKKVEHINYIFCTDEYLLSLNQAHLRHDTYTDIITFELSPKGAPLLADIYISVERVRENAGVFNSSFTRELHRVIFHGALHLCGQKDKNSADAAVMREREEEWLNKYFVSRGTKG